MFSGKYAEKATDTFVKNMSEKWCFFCRSQVKIVGTGMKTV